MTTCTKKKKKIRTLKELYKNLQVSFEQLKTSHNYLKESCESLVQAQNSPLVHEAMVVTKDVGITCDLLDSSTSDSQPTSFICDECKISLENDDIGCDESNIIIENEALVGRVNALAHVTPGFVRQTKCELCTCQDQKLTYTTIT
jgi:hypothetical protein